MTATAVIQARTMSTRLPRKVLAELPLGNVLEYVVRRTNRARSVERVIVATSTLSPDDEIAGLCEEKGWSCYRGSEEDVLDRYYGAMQLADTPLIIRITSDCPFIDPAVIDSVVERFWSVSDLDYCSNTLPPRTAPHGMDVEVVTRSALTTAWHECRRADWREHVTPFIYLTPDRFKILAFRDPPDDSWMRLTLDTQDDLALIRRVAESFGDDHFSFGDIRALLKENPDWIELNRHVQQKSVRERDR